MEATQNREREEQAIEEAVNLKISRQALDFAEFYAEIGSIDRDTLLTKIITERLKDIKEQFKTLPYIEVPELW